MEIRGIFFRMEESEDRLELAPRAIRVYLVQLVRRVSQVLKETQEIRVIRVYLVQLVRRVSQVLKETQEIRVSRAQLVQLVRRVSQVLKETRGVRVSRAQLVQLVRRVSQAHRVFRGFKERLEIPDPRVFLVFLISLVMLPAWIRFMETIRSLVLADMLTRP
jgi:hypothetical protein